MSSPKASFLSAPSTKVIEEGNYGLYQGLGPEKQEIFAYFTNATFSDEFDSTNPGGCSEREIKELTAEMEKERIENLEAYKTSISPDTKGDWRIFYAIRSGTYIRRQLF